MLEDSKRARPQSHKQRRIPKSQPRHHKEDHFRFRVFNIRIPNSEDRNGACEKERIFKERYIEKRANYK